MDTDAACDSSTSSSSSSSQGGGPPGEPLGPPEKLRFLWCVLVELQQHLDPIRLIKICSGVLADVREAERQTLTLTLTQQTEWAEAAFTVEMPLAEAPEDVQTAEKAETDAPRDRHRDSYEAAAAAAFSLQQLFR